LNAAVWFRRGRLLIPSPLSGHLRPVQTRPSTFPCVQFSRATSLRVLELTDIPNLLVVGRIDVESFLKIKDSNECQAFRSWLTTTDKINDEQLKRLITGFRARAASLIASPSGKTLRFAANAALGLIPGYGMAISLAEGVVDTFLLDKLLPSSGVLSFLNNAIPSVFKRAYD